MTNKRSATPESHLSRNQSNSDSRLQTGIFIGWTVLVLIVILVAAAMSRIILGDLSAQENSVDNSLEFSDSWIRATPPGATTAAAYIVIANSGADDDRLLSIRADNGYTVEIHTTREQAGLMRMSELDSLAIPARSSVALAPGADHLMFIDITDRFEPGDTELLTLLFEKAGPQQVSFVTRDARSLP